MRIVIPIVFAAFSVGFAGNAISQDDPIKARQDLMKSNGAAAKAAFGMAKGEIPFVEADAAEAMQTIKANMEEFPSLFPVGSETGGKTRAIAMIWEDMDGFEAEAMKLADAAGAAETAAASGLDAFKEALGAVGGSCQSCHEKYRAEKN